MSTRGLRELPIRGHGRQSRRRGGKAALDLNLNSLPPSDSIDQEGTSDPSEPPQAGQPAFIDVDSIIDDDVLISSPAAFAEAKNKARRNPRRALVHDLDSEEQMTGVLHNNHNKRRKIPKSQTIINCDYYINLEGSSNSTRGKSMGSHVMPQPPPKPKDATFNCPICMGTLVEEMSTKCGHIFCKKCIKAAIAAQSKCPTCRKRVTMKDTIRVYLPAAN